MNNSASVTVKIFLSTQSKQQGLLRLAFNHNLHLKILTGGGGGGVTRPCARARQAKRVLTQGRRGVQGRTGASRDKSLKMT